MPRDLRDWLRVGTLLIGLITCTRIAAAESLITAPDDVVVRSYVSAAAAGAFAAARAPAAEILQAAGIDIRWVDCASEAPDARCARPPGANELVLRVVWVGSSLRYRNLPLGDALIDLRNRAGSLATIYASRVAALADEAGVDAVDLMARAVAHEIGHLLLGTDQHTRHGLMRPFWTGSDLRRNQSADWTFSREEAAAMQRGVTARALDE